MSIWEHFNKHELIRREDYRICDLPDDTKAILCDIGVPKSPTPFIEFNITEIEDIMLGEQYYVIGNDFGTKICVNHQGEVLSIDLEGEYPMRYINSNLSSFLECIAIYLSFEDAMKSSDEEEIGQVIDKLKENFDLIDSSALCSNENWWPVILEQIEMGLL